MDTLEQLVTEVNEIRDRVQEHAEAFEPIHLATLSFEIIADNLRGSASRLNALAETCTGIQQAIDG